MTNFEFPINHSLISNMVLLHKLIQDELNLRGNVLNISITDALNNLSNRASGELLKIDYLFQKKSISKEMAIKAIVNILESDEIRKRSDKYIDADLLGEFRNIYDIEDEKYKGLLFKLYSGLISYDTFVKDYNKLHNLILEKFDELLFSNKKSIAK